MLAVVLVIAVYAAAAVVLFRIAGGAIGSVRDMVHDDGWSLGVLVVGSLYLLGFAVVLALLAFPWLPLKMD